MDIFRTQDIHVTIGKNGDCDENIIVQTANVTKIRNNDDYNVPALRIMFIFIYSMIATTKKKPLQRKDHDHKWTQIPRNAICNINPRFPWQRIEMERNGIEYRMNKRYKIKTE